MLTVIHCCIESSADKGIEIPFKTAYVFESSCYRVLE